jgi:hypothetical protein
MHDYLPDYLIREQMAVSALVTFGVLRVLAAALLWRRGWEAAWADKAGIAAAQAATPLSGMAGRCQPKHRRSHEDRDHHQCFEV